MYAQLHTLLSLRYLFISTLDYVASLSLNYRLCNFSRFKTMSSKERKPITSLSSSSTSSALVGATPMIGTNSLLASADLASIFECPVCFGIKIVQASAIINKTNGFFFFFSEYVLPPILQCPSGHLVCSNCRPKLQCCPTCRGPLGKIKNCFIFIFNKKVKSIYK